MESEFKRCWFIKIHGNPFMPSGTPDLLGCVDGLFFGFEVKVPGEEPSQLQIESIRDIRRAGGVGEIIETPEEAIAFVRKALRLSASRA